MRRFVVTLLLVFGAASGSVAEAALGDDPMSGSTGRRARVTVAMLDSFFRPRVVEIARGTQVRWVNRGELDHTSTGSSLWNSGLIHPGGTFSRTFRRAGTFGYVCSIHPLMTGRVVVE